MPPDDIAKRRAKVRELIKQRDEAQRDVDDELLELLNEAHKDLALCLNNYDRLSEDHDTLETNHRVLEEVHSRLDRDHASLTAQSRSLKARSVELMEDYNQLEQDNDRLKHHFNQLNEANTVLKSDYKQLEVQTHELAEQVSEGNKERKRTDRYLFVTSILLCLASVMLTFCWISDTDARVVAMILIIACYAVAREVYVGTISLWVKSTSPDRPKSSVNWKQTGLSLAITVFGGVIIILISQFVL